MTSVQFETSGWDEVVQKAQYYADQTLKAAIRAVLETSETTKERIQREMPVDTGWAQARWGVPEFGGVWDVEDGGMSIKQGSNILPYEYIERLNEGSSTQAPAGFIDAAAAAAEIILSSRINEETGRFYG